MLTEFNEVEKSTPSNLYTINNESTCPTSCSKNSSGNSKTASDDIEKYSSIRWELIKKLNAKTINKMMRTTIVIAIILIIIILILSYLFRVYLDLGIYFYSLILLTLFAIDGAFFWLLYHLDDKLKTLHNEQRKEIEISLESIKNKIEHIHKGRN